MSGLVVEPFAGPGGWDEGARLAGLDGRMLGIELDADACSTAQAAGHQRVRADAATFPLAQMVGKVDGLIASPPCQSFSQAGNRSGVNDDRGQLVWEPLRWAETIRPRWITLEQVPDVLPLWQITAARLRELGYSTWTGKLNSADYGVPQTRVRAFLTARRDGLTAGPPVASHGRDATPGLFGEVLPWVSMADALGWPPEVAYRRTRGAGLSERHGTRPDTPASAPAPTITGKSRSDVWFLGAGAAAARTAGQLARSTAEPAHTITGKGTAAWVETDGGHLARATVEEVAALQSFRPDYPWHGSMSSRHQQIGNAVPPLLAAAVLAQFINPATELGVAA